MANLLRAKHGRGFLAADEDAARFHKKLATGECILLKPIHPKRVLVRDGMSYVEGYDVKAELNRIFGFGHWSVEILDQANICETATKTRNNKDAWYVVYKTSLRLTIKPGSYAWPEKWTREP